MVMGVKFCQYMGCFLIWGAYDCKILRIFAFVKKKLLYEISIIRPLIIFLLVVYHSLCVFTGGWVSPDGVPSNDVYWWLGHLISGFRIETIAFVGGYVFCYQCVELGRRQGLLTFVWKKFKRLVVPCFVFGVIYYLLYRFNPNRFSWNVAFWRVANGIGHLWFLPMLFWCFVGCWLLDRLLKGLADVKGLRRPNGWVTGLSIVILFVLAGVSLLRLNGLRAGLTRAPYFIFYFYLGYWLRMVTKSGLAGQHDSFFNGKTVAMFWSLYAIFLLLHLQATNLYLPGCAFKCPRWLQGCSQLTLRLFNLGHTSCGILALYGTVTVWLRKHRNPESQPGATLRECSRLCYGVYVLHMFFMQWLYFYTPLPQRCCTCGVGVWLMPWLVLLLTLLPSIFGTWLLLKTRFGRFLIG